MELHLDNIRVVTMTTFMFVFLHKKPLTYFATVSRHLILAFQLYIDPMFSEPGSPSPTPTLRLAPPPPRPLPLVSNPSIVDNVLSVILILVLLKVCNQFISFHLNDKCATLMPRVEIVVPRVE